MKIKRFSKIIIKNKSDLELLNSYLYNAKFYYNDIKFIKEKGIIEMFFSRAYFEDLSVIKVKKILPFLWICKYPLIKSKLFLKGIRECYWQRQDSSLNVHKFDACAIYENTCHFLFNTLFTMYFYFTEEIEGYIEDLYFLENMYTSYICFKWKKDYFYDVRENIKQRL